MVSAVNGKVVVLNARFLPFDPSQFFFANGSKSISAADQEKIRQLNAMIRAVYAPFPVHPIRDLIDGWYAGCGGVNKTNCTIDTGYVPSGPCIADVPGAYRTCGWTKGTPKFAGIKPGFDIQNFYLHDPGKILPHVPCCIAREI